MKSLLSALIIILGFTAASVADCPDITVSTNNTPSDRRILEAIATESFGRVGCKFNLVSLPSERSLKSADEGSVDGEGLRVAGLQAQYPNLVQIAEPIHRIKFVAFTRNPDLKIASWDDLASLRVAFINGWKMFEARAANAKEINRVDSAEQMFAMLEKDRIDVVLYTEIDGRAFLSGQNITNVDMVTPPLAEVDLYLYLNKRHGELALQVADKIKAMKSSGRYQEIVDSLSK